MRAGKLFHSGLPHKSVNPLELCMEALKEMQVRQQLGATSWC